MTYFDLAMNAMHSAPADALPYWQQYFAAHKKVPDDKLWAESGKIIQAAARTGQNNSAWVETAVEMIQRNVPKYAIPILHYVSQQRPHDAAIPYHMAHAYDVGKHYALEEQALLETLRLAGHENNTFKVNHDEVRYNLARCSYSQQRLEDAKQYLDASTDDLKKSAKADYMYGIIYRDSGNQQKARGYFSACANKANDKQGRHKKLCIDALSAIKID